MVCWIQCWRGKNIGTVLAIMNRVWWCIVIIKHVFMFLSANIEDLEKTLNDNIDRTLTEPDGQLAPPDKQNEKVSLWIHLRISFIHTERQGTTFPHCLCIVWSLPIHFTWKADLLGTIDSGCLFGFILLFGSAPCWWLLWNIHLKAFSGLWPVTRLTWRLH